ncbi:MAG: fluoride efflux transporter CrcB [Hyphomonadaceae bacterium]
MADMLIGAGAVALGAAFGGPARYFVSGLVARRIGETFPWGTMAVNLAGAFLIGIAAGYARARGLSGEAPLWLFAVTGFLGSFTTVSSLALQTLALARDGQWRSALGNAALSVVFGIGAATAGLAFAQQAFAQAAAASP